MHNQYPEAIYRSGEEVEEVATLQELQASQAALRNCVELAQATQRLMNNPDFVKILGTHYMQYEPVRLANLLAANINDATRQDVIADIRAVGQLNQYLQGILNQGQAATQDLEGVNEMISQM